MGPDDVTGEWLSGIFGATVETAEHERIGDGLMGMNLRIRLRSDDPTVPASVVIKLPSPDETSRNTGIALRNYERETKFYNEVAPTVDISVPRCHHAEWHESTGDFEIVLEDLTPARQGDQITGCSVDHAHLAVIELAKLHGPRWGDPSLAGIEWLGRRTGPQDDMMLGGMWAMVFPQFLTTYERYLVPDAIALAERFGQRLIEWVAGRDGPWTVTHGDYRLDNLLFGTSDGGHPIAAVDWQTPGHGPPMGDVAYFLGAGPLPVDRAVIERDFVREYVAELRGRYELHVDDEWAWTQYRRDAFAGVIMAVIASQIVGSSERSEAMFAAMATRHLQHALDLDSESLI